MATLTLKNVPDDLHRRLKDRARRHHRSLNREAIRLLQHAVATDPDPDDGAYARAAALRDRLADAGVHLDPDGLADAIDRGRP